MAPSTSACSDARPLTDRAGRPVPPLTTYYLYLTAGCNLACRHCWITPTFQNKGGSGGHIELDVLEQALVEGKPLGLRSCKLTGGEPSLHPAFHAFCETLHRHGVGYWMESNAVLIGAAEAAMLWRTGLRFCSVSVDGASAETHDHQRAVPGAFAKTLEGIRHLADRGVHVQAIFTLTRDNRHELFDAIRLAPRLGCRSIKINLLEPTGRGQLMTLHERGLTTRELLELGQRCTALEAEAGIPVHYSWPPAFWSLRRLLRGDAGTCGVHGILGLLPDGTLAMCGIGRHVGELIYGKIGETPLAEVWAEHPRLRELRALRPSDLEGVCGRCIHAASCFGACRANTYNATHSLRAPYKLCEDAYQMGLFPPTRLRPAREQEVTCA